MGEKKNRRLSTINFQERCRNLALQKKHFKIDKKAQCSKLVSHDKKKKGTVGGGEVAVKALILGRKSKTVFFIADSLQGKIKSLVYLGKPKNVFKKNVSMDTLHRSIE